MKFLAKDPAWRLRMEGLVYRSGGHNDRLLALLREAQRGYCAYTEKRVTELDTYVVEHFDRSLKDTGDEGGDNYYGVLQEANQRKRRKEATYQGASFFATRFFQRPGAFAARVRYVAGAGVYEENDPSDHEARDLIDYLGLNDPALTEERRKHVMRLRDIFGVAAWTGEQQLEHLARHRSELSFPTALAVELGLELDPLL